MTEYEILDLLFQRYDAFQTIWGFFMTATIGILAAVISFPAQLESITGRIIMIIGFIAFSAVNLYALLELVEERESLKKEAICIVYNITDCDLTKKIDLPVEKPMHKLLKDMSIANKNYVWAFHLSQSFLILLLIWFVPKTLIKVSPSFSIKNKKINIRKSQLPSPLVSYSHREKTWKLEREIIIDLSIPGKDAVKKILVPKGFKFDLASIPRFLWPIIAPFELSIIAPLIHDYLYINEGNLFINEDGTISDSAQGKEIKISRYQSDNLFFIHMNMENVGKMKSWLSFYGVRIFGWIYWKEN